MPTDIVFIRNFAYENIKSTLKVLNFDKMTKSGLRSIIVIVVVVLNFLTFHYDCHSHQINPLTGRNKIVVPVLN